MNRGKTNRRRMKFERVVQILITRIRTIGSLSLWTVPLYHFILSGGRKLNIVMKTRTLSYQTCNIRVRPP